jgi:hypothetical protein
MKPTYSALVLVVLPRRYQSFIDKTPILRPREARENLLQCSFFRNWKGRGAGDTEIDRIVTSIDQAYQLEPSPFLEELEYVTSFLTCEVIRVDIASGKSSAASGPSLLGASSRTIVLLDTTVLAQVERIEKKASYKSVFTADLRKPTFAKTLPICENAICSACSTNAPLLSDAIAESPGKRQGRVPGHSGPLQAHPGSVHSR